MQKLDRITFEPGKMGGKPILFCLFSFPHVAKPSKTGTMVGTVIRRPFDPLVQ